MKELLYKPAWKLSKLLKKREISIAELTTSVLDQIDNMDGTIHAYIYKNRDSALKTAQRLDDENIITRSDNPLTGIPIAIKDNISTFDMETTCASKILKGYKPFYDAFVIERLRERNAVLLGKTNMDEFAMGSSTENSGVQLTLNPWDTKRIPGGSSGGSTAAVAAGEAIMALGSDTGGSIRQPAALCGVTGMKPTYGRVSRYGLIAFASSLDQIGPITRDVRDAAILLSVISGYDKRDSTSVNKPKKDFTELLERIEPASLKIGIPEEYLKDGVDIEVKRSFEKALKTFTDLGAEIINVSLPHTEYAVATYYIIATAEASSNLARYDGVSYGYRTPAPLTLLDMYEKTRREGFGMEVKRRIMLGTYALSSGYYDAYYLKAQKVRRLMSQDFEKVFSDVDVLLTPTTPTPAFRVGEKTSDPLQMYLSDIFTIPVNLAGLPGISIPCGLSSNELPIGLQIIAKPFDESMLFAAAYIYEQANNNTPLIPKIGDGI